MCDTRAFEEMFYLDDFILAIKDISVGDMKGVFLAVEADFFPSAVDNFEFAPSDSKRWMMSRHLIFMGMGCAKSCLSTRSFLQLM